jgi:diacylglycerol kinase (ATP)
MLCCTALFTLFVIPALIVSRYSRRQKVNALAWRLGHATRLIEPPESLARQLRLLLQNRIRSFAFAGAGIRHVIRNEPASWVHASATAAVFGSCFLLDIAAKDWRWIVFAVCLVWSAEAFNTAIESICDLLSPQFSEHARVAKDVGAGAVLIVSIGAAAIGFLTFWPYLAPIWPATADLSSLALSLCMAQ